MAHVFEFVDYREEAKRIPAMPTYDRSQGIEATHFILEAYNLITKESPQIFERNGLSQDDFSKKFDKFLDYFNNINELAHDYLDVVGYMTDDLDPMDLFESIHEVQRDKERMKAEYLADKLSGEGY